MKTFCHFDRLVRTLRLALLLAFIPAILFLSGCGSTTVAAGAASSAANAPTVAIAASPGSVAAGAAVMLNISATNATQITVKGSDGSSYSMAGSGGSQSVTPMATTTYTATAVGKAGTTSATAQVTVNVAAAAAATITLAASPTTILSGGSSVLTAVATNATTVTVKGSDGTSQTLQPTGGTLTVAPATSGSYTYTATATAAGGATATATAVLTVTAAANPTVMLTASPAAIVAGSSTNLVVAATNATSVTITSPGNPTYTLPGAGGTQAVTPAATTTYTATANGAAGTTPATATATVTVTPAGSLQSVQHVIFMLQENHSFDNYFGMLNPYKIANGDSVGADGQTYLVDGIDDKLTKFTNSDDPVAAGGPGDPPFSLFKFTSTCIDDLTSGWLESYGDVSRYDFSPKRPINMDGFVHTAEGFYNFCSTNPGKCSGTFTDSTGRRAMGYYDQDFLNYYYYMASNFALSDRWFSPVSSKSTPNRIATYSGGTTQGLVGDPGNDDNLPQLAINTFFKELTANNVTWKIYYTASNGGCLVATEDCSKRPKPNNSPYPALDFSYFSESLQYLFAKTPQNPTCPSNMVSSAAVGDSSDSFCIDTTHVAPLSQYYADATNNQLPDFAFIEAGYGVNDEHPGSNSSVLKGQAQVAQIVNSLMASPSWSSSVFFMAYDEGGGPFDHVPPVPGSSNINTDVMVGSTLAANIPDISTIAVAADGYAPCLPPSTAPPTNPPTPLTPTTHCDLQPADPGAHPGDAAAISGFPAQLGFRVPNMVISPFTKKHFVSHAPMDHTAILKFVEERFIPNLTTRFTPRVNAQPDLIDFFDFTGQPWLTPPTPPTPFMDNGASCNAASYGP